MKRLLFSAVICMAFMMIYAEPGKSSLIRVLVITGGHDYQKEQFNEMLGSLGDNITCQVVEFPSGFEMFKPENRNKYDVLVFYHMWQEIDAGQEKDLSECIKNGKPLVVLHHSICAFDNWPEYYRIIGGKYFHKPTVVDGTEYAACSYRHDVHFSVKVKSHPITSGLKDFEIFDETYKGFYVEPGVTPLLTTDDPGSSPVIGWAKMYGKARVVTIQSGHDVPTYQSPVFRQLLRQSIEWVYNKGKN